MRSRAMIIVGGGSSTRFGGDKLMTDVAGRPLISHTIAAVADAVDVCVVVCRADVVGEVARLHPEVVVTEGGTTRTASEMAGLAALGDQPGLIGIHDAARPAVTADLVQRLFVVAAEHGGALPVLDPEGLIVNRTGLRPVDAVALAQTPQVFRGPELVAAYAMAAEAGFEGHDTVEVVQRFSDLDVVAVPGEEENVKVTYPADLATVSALLSDPSRT